MSQNLDALKQKMIEFLSFTSLTKEEIENLFKVALSQDCEMMNVTMRKFPQAVTFDVGTRLDKQVHQKVKVLSIKVKTINTLVHQNLEHTKGKFKIFTLELRQ